MIKTIRGHFEELINGIAESDNLQEIKADKVVVPATNLWTYDKRHHRVGCGSYKPIGPTILIVAIRSETINWSLIKSATNDETKNMSFHDRFCGKIIL